MSKFLVIKNEQDCPSITELLGILNEHYRQGYRGQINFRVSPEGFTFLSQSIPYRVSNVLKKSHIQFNHTWGYSKIYMDPSLGWRAKIRSEFERDLEELINE